MSFRKSSTPFDRLNFQDSEVVDVSFRPSASDDSGNGKSRSGAKVLIRKRSSGTNAKPTVEQPHWVPDSEAPYCFCCSEEFTFKHRRHHCRSCGKVVCNTCSHHRLEIPFMGFKNAVRCCDNCFSAYRISSSGSSPARIIAFLNMFFHDSVNVKLDKRKRVLVERLQQLNKDHFLLEAIETSKLPALNSWSMMLHIDGIELDSNDDEDDLKRCESALLPEIDAVEDERSLRSATVFDRSSTFTIKPVHKMSTPDLHEELFVLRLYGATFFVKEQSKFHTCLFYRRMLIISPEGEIILTGSVGKDCVDSDEYEQSSSVEIRKVKHVSQIASVGFGDIPSAISRKPSTAEPEEERRFGRSRSNSESVKAKSRSHSYARNPRGSVEDIGILHNQCLRIDWNDGTEPFNLLVLGFDYSICKDQLVESIQVIKAHQQKYRLTERKAIDTLKEKMNLTTFPVSWEDEQHSQKLEKLWKIVKDSPFPGRKHEEWKTLGFQGQDPQTDFRGMGALALEAIIYWAETFPKTAKYLVEIQPERAYPLCTAAINCVAKIFELLQVDFTKDLEEERVRQNALFRLFCSCRDDKDAFFEVFAILLRILDKLSVEMEAGYMDIPLVFQAMMDEFQSHLSQNPCDISTLHRWATQ